ncbi:MAG: YhbY family RNA-binding protein [Candidatus Heimdallarchaeota archaeon]
MNREIINKLLHTPATIQVGKQGVTDTLLQELKAQLEKRKIVKVRILKSVENIDETLQQLERLSSGKIAKKVGNTAIIVKTN